jgi:hypothetical protein
MLQTCYGSNLLRVKLAMGSNLLRVKLATYKVATLLNRYKVATAKLATEGKRYKVATAKLATVGKALQYCYVTKFNEIEFFAIINHILSLQKVSINNGQWTATGCCCW